MLWAWRYGQPCRNPAYYCQFWFLSEKLAIQTSYVTLMFFHLIITSFKKQTNKKHCCGQSFFGFHIWTINHHLSNYIISPKSAKLLRSQVFLKFFLNSGSLVSALSRTCFYICQQIYCKCFNKWIILYLALLNVAFYT